MTQRRDRHAAVTDDAQTKNSSAFHFPVRLLQQILTKMAAATDAAAQRQKHQPVKKQALFVDVACFLTG